MAVEHRINQRLSYEGALCTVRYVGPVEGTKGSWLGVEWDDSSRGKHNGAHGCIEYFKCLSRQPTAASFIRPTRASDTPREFVEAVKHKYTSNEFTGAGVYSVHFNEDESVRISGKEVEEVGFDKIRSQLSNLNQLRILLVDTLCIHRPFARKRILEDPNRDMRATDVADICQKIIELDVSRNLFEDWSEVMDICRQMPYLTKLRAEGNRFSSLETSIPGAMLETAPFTRITTLGLDDTLLPWPDASRICASFPSLTSLSVDGNEYEKLQPAVLPQTLTTISLERNKFTSLEDVHTLSSLPLLSRLVLRQNSINSTGDAVFQESLFDLDLALNSIATWTAVDSLTKTVPGLTSLRVSQNPLFRNLKDADGKPQTPEDGYMLALARIARLSRLNLSNITPKERLDAELYYVSQMSREIALADPGHRMIVRAGHARYEELFRKYDQPSVQAPNEAKNGVDPRSLAAQLIHVSFNLAADVAVEIDTAIPNAQWMSRIPKSFAIYSVLGVVGKHFCLPPTHLRLVWETGEEDFVPDEVDDDESEYGGADEGGVRTRLREDVLVPASRPLGSWIEGSEARVRVEWDHEAVRRARRAQADVTATTVQRPDRDF